MRPICGAFCVVGTFFFNYSLSHIPFFRLLVECLQSFSHCDTVARADESIFFVRVYQWMVPLAFFGYGEDDIVMLTDDQSDPQAIPTRENIVRVQFTPFPLPARIILKIMPLITILVNVFWA